MVKVVHGEVGGGRTGRGRVEVAGRGRLGAWSGETGWSSEASGRRGRMGPFTVAGWPRRQAGQVEPAGKSGGQDGLTRGRGGLTRRPEATGPVAWESRPDGEAAPRQRSAKSRRPPDSGQQRPDERPDERPDDASTGRRQQRLDERPDDGGA
ncbi:hypothetical protein GCM10029964_070900 [Kibdelosporangium lantanae]